MGSWPEPPEIINPDAHHIRHQDGGADEIEVTGLSGLLADDQHVLDAEVVSAVEANALSEIRLTPKASSSGAEGTIFYDSDDDHVYVGTE